MAEWIVEANSLGDLVEGLWIGGKRLVRCKKCMHYDGRYCITPSKAIPRHENWFCADGEREVEE